jgi:carbon storage regulator
LEVIVLVLSRRETESIVIPQCRVEIFVVAIEGDKVKLGIRAPDDIDIYRDEVWQRMCFDRFLDVTKEEE